MEGSRLETDGIERWLLLSSLCRQNSSMLTTCLSDPPKCSFPHPPNSRHRGPWTTSIPGRHTQNHVRG